MVAVAVGIRLLLQPWVGLRGPYSTVLVAVFCAVLLGGTGPGLLATALGALAAAYFLIPPQRSLSAWGEFEFSGLLVYVAASAIAIWVVRKQRTAALRLSAEIERRKAAEDAERVQREFFQVTLASIGDGVIATDEEGRVTFLNPVAAGLTGWTPGEALGRRIDEVFVIRNEETGVTVENPVARAIREGRVIGLANHTVLLAKDGRRIPIDDSGAPILSLAGKVLGAVLIFRDVTVARAQEAELRMRDRMIDFSHDAIIVTDARRRIVRWNSGARELYGWTAAEAVGKVTHEFLKTSGPAPVSAIDAVLCESGCWDGELTHTCKDGRVIIVESRQVRLGDGILEINRDITGRIRAEEGLKKAAAEAEEGRRTLEALMRHIPEGITIADAPDGRVRMVSRYGAFLTGRSRDRLENVPSAEQPSAWGVYRADGVTPATPEELPLTRAVRQGQVVTDEEWVIKRPDGTPIPILCNAGPIADAEGRIEGGIVAWRDISERKKLEEKVRETARLESLGVLAGGIAHDFNNLLTGVVGNASLLLDDLPEGTAEWGLANGVLAAAERAAQLTRQMLAYSGRGRFVVEPVELSNFVRETLPLIRSSIPKRAELRLNLAENVPAVEADVAQLQQLVMNLVVNGGEAIGPDGGRLSIVTRAEVIDREFIAALGREDNLKPGLYVIFEVQDTGCGMDEKTAARIFDPFFTTKFTGRGLGLAAVQGIVRGHKGAIKVYSAPGTGTGTTFRVLLPAHETAKTEAAQPGAATAIARDGAGTVLLVDDEEIVRSTAKTALERLGYSVLLAADGEEAVHVFRAMPAQIKLVVLDMTMPGITGEETLQRLRQIRPEIPVVLTSGFSEQEAMLRFGGKRLSGFLQKPFTMRALADKVRLTAAASA